MTALSGFPHPTLSLVDNSPRNLTFFSAQPLLIRTAGRAWTWFVFQSRAKSRMQTKKKGMSHRLVVVCFYPLLAVDVVWTHLWLDVLDACDRWTEVKE
jgi:hypothetical protein